ncbi:MAG: 3-deoxy-7-phosphoheptulonate synthase [Gammaproteobacteria bacterium]|nr:3-deoxy-7-phosphoheptulonate synthase [Gammaproteobacteria bacterium]MCP4475564.1 3-deoxy-7-phosphoheptulonate synthase [Gammaproteobacteria bacterium]
MILLLDNHSTALDIQQLQDRLAFMGFHTATANEGNDKAIAIISGIDQYTKTELFSELPLVKKVLPFNDRFKLVGRALNNALSVINIKGRKIGGGHFAVMAGPCSIESPQQISAIASAVAKSGATILRGGAFKPRTSPYDFQGLGEAGLKMMRQAADDNDLLVVSEVMSVDALPQVANYVDILQIGARNMQNYDLLKAVGRVKRPVLLKRGLSATYKEFLLAAEYILSNGNPDVILCERGIRTFESYSRNTLDLAAVPILRELTHLPIIIDPSHGTGLRHAVIPMANAAMAVEADGVMVEVHTDPDRSISDAKQTISTEMFGEMMVTLRKVGDAVGRSIAS